MWMGIYDQHTLAAYGRRNGSGPSVKRLQAMVAAAGARMDGIEALVADMARRATPARRRAGRCGGCSSRLDARG